MDQHSATTQPADTHREYGLLTFDPGVGIWAVFTFVALLFLLRKTAWKPILDSIDAREQKMRDAMKAAEETQAAAKRIDEEQRAILAQTRDETNRMVEEARKGAQEIRDRILLEAEHEKDQVLTSTRREIQGMLNEARAELKTFSARLAVNATEKLLRDSIDHARSESLALRAIDEMQKDSR